MKFLKRIFTSLFRAAVNVMYHDGIEHAGYLSFLVLFAIFPFIVFFLTLTSIFGFSESGVKFIDYMMKNIPGDAVQKRINEIFSMPPKSLLSLAIFGSIWTASSFVEGLRTILNRIYNITAPPSYIFRRMLSIIQFFIISLFLFFTMMVLIIIPVLLRKFIILDLMVAKLSIFYSYIRYLLVFNCLLFSISMLYWIIPNIKIKYKQVLPGAFLAVCLCFVSGFALSYYVNNYYQNFIYGSLGNMIVTLIFFYVVNIIFIYGAEFNYQMHVNKKY